MTKKQGKYGMLYFWRIHYQDSDPCLGPQKWNCWAYNQEHAIQKFWESFDLTESELEKIKILNLEKVEKVSQAQ